MRPVDRERLEYVPFYCEENVWKLLQHESFNLSHAWALLVSNAERRVIYLRQRAGRPVDGLVQWDYHVFVLLEDALEGYLVMDLDSELPFPCPLRRYLEESFPGDVRPAQVPAFRALRSRDYVDGLVSDRSHMKRADGTWLAPPPLWNPPGFGSRRPPNLMQLIDMGLRQPGRLIGAELLRSISLANRRDDGRLPR